MEDREDITLELNELRAALLERQEEENEEPLWQNHNVADDSFLRHAAAIDIEASLETIGTRFNRLKNELSAAALALAPDSTNQNPPQFAAAPSDALDTIASLRTELSKCSAELVSQNSLSKFEAEELEAREARLTKIARLEQLLNALHLLASHQRLCDGFDKKVEQGQVVEATTLLASLDDCTASMVKISSTASGGGKNSSNMSAARVAKAARTQARARRAALQARLDEALVYAIQTDPVKHEIVVSLDTKCERLQQSVRLESVIEALKAMRTLSTRLQERVVQPFLAQFLLPVLKEPERYTVEQDLSDPNRPCIRLKTIKSVEEAQMDSTTTAKQICHKAMHDVQLILRFVWTEILNRDCDVNQQMGLFSNHVEPLLKNVLRAAVPESFDELQSFERDVSARAIKFDQELERIGSTNRTSGKLSDFVSDVEVNFARKLRERFAERTRQAIRCNEDLQGSERVDEGEEPEFFIGTGDFAVPGDMRVSRTAKKVVRIANEALTEATKAPSVCTNALIKASRSCFDLFRTLVPYLRKDEMQVNPRCAMLHRNDYDYIAHHLVLLAHRYRTLKAFVSVDMAPYFFEEADVTYEREVQFRCKQIEDTFASSALDFGEILSRSDAIYRSWNEVLPSRLIEQTRVRLGDSLVEGVFKAVCSPEANIASLPERRTILKRLMQFSEAVKTRGASSKRIDQLCKALQPHMSLFPLFADLVDAELQDWPPESLVGLANALFSKSATQEQLKRFEEKVLFY